MNRFQVLAAGFFVILLAIATAIYVRGVNIPILEPAGPVALAEKNIIVFTFFLCCLVIVPVFFLLFLFAWRYREGNPRAHVEHKPDWDHDNLIAELIWWLVPAVIIAILGVVAWQSSHALNPYNPIKSSVPTLTIDVVSLDWKWLFIYPEQGIASVNLVEFPVGTPVHFYLTSDAPMNSFWIPQLAGQIMTMPGMTTQLNLAANRTGDFNGASANISGKGFAGMAFTARAVSQDEFDAWIASVEASSTPLSWSAYETLAQPSEYNPVTTYAPVLPNLFNEIRVQYLNPDSPGSSMMYMSM